MTRRKGELSPSQIDSGWPHQVALRERDCARGNYHFVRAFCRWAHLSLCDRGHAVFDDGEWWRVFCFRKPEDAALFRQRFDGVPFDPRHRGRGASWARWHRPGP